MKQRFLSALVPCALLAASNAMAGPQSCAARIDAIQGQIEVARQHGNTHQLIGLQTALAQTRAHCTEAGQEARAEHEARRAREDVRDARQDVREAEQKLREAQARRDPEKIIKAQEELGEKQFKLRGKMEDLGQAQAGLAALKG